MSSSYRTSSNRSPRRILLRVGNLSRCPSAKPLTVWHRRRLARPPTMRGKADFLRTSFQDQGNIVSYLKCFRNHMFTQLLPSLAKVKNRQYPYSQNPHHHVNTRENTNAVSENARLLETISETEYATSALSQSNSYIANLKNDIARARKLPSRCQ